MRWRKGLGKFTRGYDEKEVRSRAFVLAVPIVDWELPQGASLGAMSAAVSRKLRAANTILVGIGVGG